MPRIEDYEIVDDPPPTHPLPSIDLAVSVIPRSPSAGAGVPVRVRVSSYTAEETLALLDHTLERLPEEWK